MLYAGVDLGKRFSFVTVMDDVEISSDKGRSHQSQNLYWEFWTTTTKNWQ